MSAPLRRVIIERRDDGTFLVTRERDATGERMVCEDLLDVFAWVSLGYRPDGSARAASHGTLPVKTRGRQERKPKHG